MENRSIRCDLFDPDGLPIGGELGEVLRRLGPRLRREFPSLSDEVELAEVLEETGRRVMEYAAEEHIEHLPGFTRVTARHVALSRIRTGSHQLRLHSVSSEESATIAAIVDRACRVDAHIEVTLLVRQVLSRLTELEAQVCQLKIAGYASREIAGVLGCSADAVNSAYCRAKARLRAVLTPK